MYISTVINWILCRIFWVGVFSKFLGGIGEGKDANIEKLGA